MFWKSDKPPLFVEPTSDNARHAFRVTPGEHPPVALQVEGTPVEILNISATGVAYRLDKATIETAPGRRLQGALFFDDPQLPHPVTLEVVDEVEGCRRCRLQPDTPQAEKALGHYVVQRQKQEIRRRQLADQAVDEN